jgi:alpha-beta hydrolase superfamily lysophospholipase
MALASSRDRRRALTNAHLWKRPRRRTRTARALVVGHSDGVSEGRTTSSRLRSPGRDDALGRRLDVSVFILNSLVRFMNSVRHHTMSPDARAGLLYAAGMTITFGSRARVATFISKLADATTGNKDGIVGNEGAAANTAPKTNWFDTNPLLFSLKQQLAVGVSKNDETASLATFLSAFEQGAGPVTSLSKPAHVDADDFAAFRLDKAITLVRFGRTPADVTDHVVSARGSVDGAAIAPRDVFVQHYAPQGTPTGKTIVVSPGFFEDGRHHTEQAMLLSAAGHSVVVLDHQWAGLSSTSNGGIDRGFGIARDVAAVAGWAHAAEPNNTVVLLGTSMGGGAGVVGALTMNDLGRVQLDGPAMPRGIDGVVQGAFFERSSSVVNATLAAVGRVPLLRDIPLPATGMPILSGDQATLRKLAAHATTEQLTGRAQAFHASTDDLATITTLLKQGHTPAGRVYALHADKDTLADHDSTRDVVALLGDRGHFHSFASTSHVIEEHPVEQQLVFNALAWLDR